MAVLAVDFRVNYHSPGCGQTSPAPSAAANMTSAMTTTAAMLVTSAVGSGTTPVVGGRGGDGGVVGALAGDTDSTECRRESSLLFLLLVLGTVWLGLSLYNFTKTLVKFRIPRLVLNYEIAVVLLKCLSNLTFQLILFGESLIHIL